jgi:hypothetical protein
MDDEINIQPIKIKNQIAPRMRGHKTGRVSCDLAVTKENRFSHEHNDCTVRALTRAAKVSYPVAHEHLQDAGRKAGKGFCLSQHLRLNKQNILGNKIVELKNVERWTFGKFANENTSGRFVIRAHKHVAAVINGVLYDAGNSSNMRVIEAFLFVSDNQQFELPEI